MTASPSTHTTARPSAGHIWLALGAVYLIWGSTYLAIRVAIETLPPLLMAGVRFLLAGAVLLLLSARRDRGAHGPVRPRHWLSALVVGALLLLGGNGGVVLAEQRVPSGIAALMVATVPLFMAVLDRWRHGARLGALAVAGLLVGFAGVALLIAPRAGGSVDPVGAALLMGASLTWSAGSLYARRAPLPRRPGLATGMEMLAGGACLAAAGLLRGEAAGVRLGEISGASAVAFAYLVVFGSLVGFTAYIWLLGSAPTSLVGTYAYVNPVVALALGWAILEEPMTGTVAAAAAVIVAGVAMIVVSRSAGTPEEVEVGSPADAPCPPEPAHREGRARLADRAGT